MAVRVVVVVESGVAADAEELRRSVAVLSDALQEEILLARVTGERLRLTRSTAISAPGLEHDEVVQPRPQGVTARGAPMGAAPFVYRADGRPDWQRMWTTFCELALFPSTVPAAEGATAYDALAEIQRGVWETTGLRATPAEPGWVAVQCHSAKMAAWLCATILLENVDARCEGDRLFLPASPSFALADEVKSVITVLAKTHHYWDAHVAPVME
jgi:sirohydrochlorin cobaltochelatase